MARHNLSYLRDLAASPELLPWEALALCPKPVRLNELGTRARIALTLRDLRAGRTLELDPDAVLGEARKLVLDQTKAVNAVRLYEPEELAALVAACDAEPRFSRLLLWARNVRRLTEGRYAAYVAGRGPLSERVGYEQHMADGEAVADHTGLPDSLRHKLAA